MALAILKGTSFLKKKKKHIFFEILLPKTKPKTVGAIKNTTKNKLLIFPN